MRLDPESVKELFASVIIRAKKKFDFRLENFCIMGNHYHFIIQPGRGENLSAIMQWILSVFAMAYNRRMKLSGRFWEDRFYSRVIKDLDELIHVSDYIDANPVVSGLVADKRDWRWGGLWHHLTSCRDIIDEPASWLLYYVFRVDQQLLEGPL
jgi:Transposase and inactivated derivatives